MRVGQGEFGRRGGVATLAGGDGMMGRPVGRVRFVELLLAWTGLNPRLGRRRSSYVISLLKLAAWSMSVAGILRLSAWSAPFGYPGWRSGTLRWQSAWSRGRSAPLRSRRSADVLLVCLRMHVLRCRGVACVGPACLAALEQLQSRFDVDIGWIEVCSAAVRIQGIARLVVAGLVLQAVNMRQRRRFKIGTIKIGARD